jgi:Tol biopolymer transport system component/class 3 adenylate cyclase
MTEPQRLPRKLAAILYGDVTGYSRLTAADEDSTHRRLSEYLDLFSSTVHAHGGRVMHYAGDAVLAKFDAVLDALTCAAAVQRELARRNSDLPADRRVEFGMGVNLGDVIEDRGDIYGDGVNVAARLEGLAGPREICVSEAVRTAVGKRLPLNFADLGEQMLKNIDQPVRAYRAEVSAEASSDWPPSAASQQLGGPLSAHGRGRLFQLGARPIVYLLGAAALAAVLLTMTFRDDGTADVTAPSAAAASAPSFTPLTFDGGQKDHARLSPDGELVAYTWNSNDHDGDGLNDFDIYVRAIGRDTAPIQVTTGAADYIAPAWSPDSRALAFVRLELHGSRASIHQAHALGGQTRQIVELPAFPVSRGVFIGWLAWSPDGKSLVYGERAADEVAARLVRLDLDTLAKSPLTTAPSIPNSVGDLAPSYSPDGTRIAFVRGGSGYNNLDVWIMDADGQGARQITASQWEVLQGLGWAANGRDVLFTAGDLVRTRSYSVPISGGPPALLPGLGENDRGASAAAERLVFTKFGTSGFYIWEVPGRLADDPSAPPKRIRDGSLVVTSPRGDQIAWQTGRTGSPQIWLAAADGSNERQLTDQRTTARLPQWSGDSRHIAFTSTEAGNDDVYIVEVSSGRVTPLTTDPGNDRNATYSRDGRWLYFASNRSGAFEIYRMRSDGGEATPMTEGGGLSARESYDGRFLYYMSDMDDQGAATLFRLPLLDGGEPTELFTAVFDAARWFLTSEGIYYTDIEPQPTSFAVRYFDFATGSTVPIYEDADFIGALTVSPDEKRVFITRRDLPESELWLVENFR